MKHTWVTPLTMPTLHLRYKNNVLAPLAYVNVIKKVRATMVIKQDHEHRVSAVVRR